MKIKKYRHHHFFGRKIKRRQAPASPTCTAAENLTSNEMIRYLNNRYRIRVNLLTEQAEYLPLCGTAQSAFAPISKRQRNTLVTEMRLRGIKCNATELMEYCYSNHVEAVHPFRQYLTTLPSWDGRDRVMALAMRISTDATWIMVFRRWMRMMTAQWMQVPMQCANMMVPILISQKQGTGKSSFCRMLIPPELQNYYMDKLDFTQKSNIELKMAQYGLINLDEFDRYGERLMPLFKNITQMQSMIVRRAYASNFNNLPRIASFIGTSNRTDLLTDLTGSRRFYCQEVTAPIDTTPPDYPQLYAQLCHEVNEGLPLYYSKDEETLIEQHNSTYYRMTILQQTILRCYRLPDEGEQCAPVLAREIRDTILHRYPKIAAGYTLRQLVEHLKQIAPAISRNTHGYLYPLIKIR